MKFRTGLKPTLGLIDELLTKARETNDADERKKLTSVARLMLVELRHNQMCMNEG